MRQSLHVPLAPGRKLAATVCLLAVVLLWTPLWAADWQAHGMACCNAGLCPAHRKPATTPVPPQNSSEDCDHHSIASRPTGNVNCTMSCCRDASVSFTNAIVFLLPQPTLLSQPGSLLAAVSIFIPSESGQVAKPLSPPPRSLPASL